MKANKELTSDWNKIYLYNEIYVLNWQEHKDGKKPYSSFYEFGKLGKPVEILE